MTGTIPSTQGPRTPPPGRLLIPILRLARPKQWLKSAFVLIGPFYGLRDLAHAGRSIDSVFWPAVLTAALFAITSSACYIINDIFDREADRLHPRKRNRPIASGAVSVPQAWLLSISLLILAVAGACLLPAEPPVQAAVSPRPWVLAALALYAGNVALYSALSKHLVIADVISLSLGFVLRVMAGCWAVGIMPSVWLLNITLFLAMFLSFGKRLGERRTLAPVPGATNLSPAALHRPVHAAYTDTLLQMAVVVTGVATLMGYAAYIQTKAEDYIKGFNLLWLTIIPVTYCILRAIVMVERGQYDDPTELATRDRAFQVSAALFIIITIAVLWVFRAVPPL